MNWYTKSTLLAFLIFTIDWFALSFWNNVTHLPIISSSMVKREQSIAVFLVKENAVVLVELLSILTVQEIRLISPPICSKAFKETFVFVGICPDEKMTFLKFNALFPPTLYICWVRANNLDSEISKVKLESFLKVSVVT